MLQYLRDNYEIQAADVAAAWAGRGWNPRTGVWETVSGVDLSLSENTELVLRSFALIVVRAVSRTQRYGVHGALFVVSDRQATASMVRLPGKELQGGSRYIEWSGSFPLGCGAIWRIRPGGLELGDLVMAHIAFEGKR